MKNSVSRLYEKLLSTEKLHKCLIYAPVVSNNHPKALFRPIPNKSFFQCYLDGKGNISRSFIDRENWDFLCRELPNGTPVEIADPRVSSIDGKIHGIGFLYPEEGRISVFHTIRRQFHTIPLIDANFWKEKIERAHQQRIDCGLIYSGNDSYRLIHGAADGIPGLLVDIFGNSCHVKIRQDGPLFGALHAVYAFLCIRGVEKFWIDYPKHDRRAFFGNEFLNPVFHENGIQMCIRQAIRKSAQDDFHFDNRFRAIRALLQTMSIDRHALDIFAGEGFSTLAMLHGSPRSVMALETRVDKREDFLRIDKLSNAKKLEFPQFEKMSDYISQFDTEGFQLVHLSIPENLDDIVEAEKLPTNTLLSKLIYQGMRCCSTSGYFIISGSCFMTSPKIYGPVVCEAIRNACGKLLRPVQQIRVVQPGPDIQSNLSGVVYSEMGTQSATPFVGLVFKLH